MGALTWLGAGAVSRMFLFYWLEPRLPRLQPVFRPEGRRVDAGARALVASVR